MMPRSASLPAAIQPTSLARAPRHCERPATKVITTLTRVGLASLLAIAAACGGGSRRTDTYAAATDEQTRCCEHLAGAPRDQCLAEIVRVDDPAAARTSENQRTYACVERHFTCDPATGHATADSNQRQLDCISDLGE